MHPYEMIRLMRYRRDDRLVAITNGTMYHTVASARDGPSSSPRSASTATGNRPERTTYAVTDAGRAAVTEWVRRELPRVDHPAEFRIALAEAHNLDRAEVDLAPAHRIATRGRGAGRASPPDTRPPSPRACRPSTCSSSNERTRCWQRTSSGSITSSSAWKARSSPGGPTSPASAISHNERPHGYDRTSARKRARASETHARAAHGPPCGRSSSASS